MKKYKSKDGKLLKYGYTTGSCATAAAKAAAHMLFNNETIEEVKINTPKGWELNLEVINVQINEDNVVCAIKKDAGDDPDVTHEMKIFARVTNTKNKNEFKLTGGIGIGKITKKGLAIEVGKYAINPVPRKTIKEEVLKVIKENQGVKVEIFAPEGVDIAKKTFNPRLGIVGGISILGTSGIVEPMSEDAIKKSLSIELNMLKEKGYDEVILTPGNYGMNFLKENNYNLEVAVKVSNFLGYMLDEARRLKFKKILLVGHCGKFVKVAGGSFNTHSKMSDARREVFAAHVALLGSKQKTIERIMNCVTTEEIVEIIYSKSKYEAFKNIANKITEKSKLRIIEDIEIGSIIFSSVKGELSKCDVGEKIAGDFIE